MADPSLLCEGKAIPFALSLIRAAISNRNFQPDLRSSVTQRRHFSITSLLRNLRHLRITIMRYQPILSVWLITISDMRSNASRLERLVYPQMTQISQIGKN